MDKSLIGMEESAEAVIQNCTKFRQISQENTCAEVSFLMKFQILRPATLLKSERFPNEFSKVAKDDQFCRIFANSCF